MKIKQISYRRVRNLGNYETETLECVAEVNEDDLKDVYVELKVATMKLLGLHVSRDKFAEDVRDSFEE